MVHRHELNTEMNNDASKAESVSAWQTHLL